MSEQAKRTSNEHEYEKPAIRTLNASAVVEALGPVSAGSGSGACGPMLANFCVGE